MAVGMFCFECVGGWMRQGTEVAAQKVVGYKSIANCSTSCPLFFGLGTFQHDHLSDRASRSECVARTVRSSF